MAAPSDLNRQNGLGPLFLLETTELLQGGLCSPLEAKA